MEKLYIFGFREKWLKFSSCFCLFLVSEGILEGKIVLKHIYFKEQTHK